VPDKKLGGVFDPDLSRGRLHRLVEAGHRLLGLDDLEDEAWTKRPSNGSSEGESRRLLPFVIGG
jgi:hypothetical protein